MESIQLLGNASVGLSRLRRKKLLKSVNPDIVDLAEEIFEGAAPILFGSGFEKKMKERAESIKLLSASKPSHPTSSLQHQFFQRGCPTAPQEVAAKRTGGGLGRKNLPGSNLPEPTQVLRLKYCYLLFKNQSLISLLVHRGVAPLAVDMSIIAGIVDLFQVNWSRVSEDQWLLDTIQGYKIEFVGNPTQDIFSHIASSVAGGSWKNALQKGNCRGPCSSMVVCESLSPQEGWRHEKFKHPITSRWKAYTH